MSKIDDFGKKLKSSPDVQKEIGGAYERLGEELSQARVTYCNRVADIAKQHGFDVTAEEVGQKFESGIEELSEDQLDAVAGGISRQVQPMRKQMMNVGKLPGRGRFAGT